MSPQNPDSLKFIQQVALPPIMTSVVPQSASEDSDAIYEEAKKQARVVGSGLFAFEKGVTEELRTGVTNSALLAQLAADRKVSAEENPIGWFEEYAHVLGKVGWVIQDWNKVNAVSSGTLVEVHEKILEVATVVLGGGTTALAIVAASVEALKKMDQSSSWFKIFNRESQKARMARFQIGLVSEDPSGDASVSLLAYVVHAESNLTQVLFFKFQGANATFEARSAKHTLNKSLLKNLNPEIEKRVLDYSLNYISSIVEL